ncbi:MAG: hypothetical protein CMA03_01270 [Euryarchaeota archaeon]|nr:hypothetical protein [Euryarchaeota archaeon]
MINSAGRAHLENTIGGKNGHIFRRLIHVSMLVFPFVYYWYGNQISEYLTTVFEREISREFIVTFLLIFIVIAELGRLFLGITIFGQRDYEKKQISALAWGGVSICICFLFAPLGGYKEAYIGLPIIFTISIVDPLLGETRKILDSNKLIILIALIVSFLIWFSCSIFLETPLWFSLIMPPLAIIAEWPSLKYIDDNATMILLPLIASLVLI